MNKQKIWTLEEIEWLKDNFVKLTNKEISNILNRTLESISQKAKRLKLLKLKECNSEYAKNESSKAWSYDDLQFLRENFGNVHPDIIKAHIPNRTWLGIKHKANRLGLKYSRKDTFTIKPDVDKNGRKFASKFTRTNNLEILLNESYESFYWLGFLMADGHFSEKRLSIMLSIKDKSHLLKFAKFIGIDYVLEDHRICQIAVQNKSVIKTLRDRLGIVNHKTTNPCNLLKSNIEHDKLFALTIGYIDGDGCIKNPARGKSAEITIACHSSWLNNLEIFGNCLGFTTKPRIDGRGLATISLQGYETVKNIKLKALEFKLPLLERKWSRIDVDYKTRFELYANKLANIKILQEEGLTEEAIASELNLSRCMVWRLKKKGLL